MSVSPAVIKNTQNSLGKYVSKPPLTEKLLKKPPFRFLHDIFSVVIKSTGALQGLLDDKEMASENVKDRESKIKYLEKVIKCISIASGKKLSAKPGKIVAGQEPEKTNELLQALATILDKNIDTSEAVEKVLHGEKPSGKANGLAKPARRGKENNGVPSAASSSSSGSKRGVKASASSIRDRSNSRDKGHGSSRESTANNRSRESTAGSHKSNRSLAHENHEAMAENETGADSGLGTLEEDPGEHRSDTAEQNGFLESGGEVPREDPRPEVDMHASSETQDHAGDEEGPEQLDLAKSKTARPGSRRPIDPDEGLGNEPADNAAVFGSENPAESTAINGAPVPRPGSAMKSARPRTGRLKSGRPPSARPAAPTIREKKEILAEEEIQARPMTGKVANVIVAGEDDNDEDNDNDEFLIEEKPKDNIDLLAEDSTPQTDAVALETNGEEHGALVQQILETQKELEEAKQPDKISVEIEREGGLSDVGRKRDREATQREVDKLRTSIQTLTRSANPLGKLMDFLQEDVDAMQRELENWKKDNQQLNQQLKHEKNLTEQSIEPLKAHLIELEGAVQEQLDKISIVKSNILKNDERISKMLLSIGTAAR